MISRPDYGNILFEAHELETASHLCVEALVDRDGVSIGTIGSVDLDKAQVALLIKALQEAVS